MKKVLWEMVFSLMSFGSIAVIIAPNVPTLFYVLGWLYIILMLCAGVFTLYSERITAWCDKKLGNTKDE
ncbi:hypothetical protein DZ860_00665 [Vibrio sinensis]|uniref:Uncharacterized protein n=1 Tax=Vibrio sinensis TaxID=2302434 RepID=A0A3A6RDN8_9VIBR|nr:hypothetical protein DZ860_00665 [Vibrio sinensis]